MKTTLTTQQKAGITNRKNRAIKKYQSAESAGIKASIARQFRKDFNVELKAEILAQSGEPIEVSEKRKYTKRDKSINPKHLIESKVSLGIPLRLQSFLDELKDTLAEANKRILKLEKQLAKA